MKITDKLTFLDDELSERINGLKKKRQRNKIRAFGLKITAIWFAAAITILLGIEGFTQFGTLFKNVALILGASITVINAVDAFFDHRALWIRQSAKLVKLLNLRRDLRFFTIGVEPEDVDMQKLTELKNRFNQILEDDLEEWLKLRNESSNQSKAPLSSPAIEKIADG